MLKFTRKSLIGFSVIAVIAIAFVSVYISGNKKPKDVILVTHDSFVMSEDFVSDFNATTGYKLKLLKAGDVGSLTNRLILTKDTPIGDAVFGIDNTFAGVATKNNLIDGTLKPTDFGDVCFNYDKAWFSQHKIPAPTSIDDLILPAYKGLSVVENPNTSSTGLSFLAATVDKYGDANWQAYWSSLKENGVKVDNGWETAYYTDFSGSSGKGDYPIVLSYASSPADEVRADGKTQTAAILDGCFRQTEYAGVLTNAKNPAGAEAVIKYLLSKKFQASFPTNMYMYPIASGIEIPENWSKYTQVAEKAYGADLDFNANRKSWLIAWSAIFD